MLSVELTKDADGETARAHVPSNNPKLARPHNIFDFNAFESWHSDDMHSWGTSVWTPNNQAFHQENHF